MRRLLLRSTLAAVGVTIAILAVPLLALAWWVALASESARADLVGSLEGMTSALLLSGAIVGLSRFNTNAHLARATLEAICYQSKDVVDAMEKDSCVHLEVLKVDGGVTANDLCMQIQADVLGVEVSKPVVAETTALGAAYAAGLAVGFWKDTDELRKNWNEGRRWSPQWDDEQREAGHAQWKKAVSRTLDWVDVD